MKLIKPLNINGKSVVWEIINSKHRAIQDPLLAVRQSINTRIDEYISLLSAGTLDNLSQSPHEIMLVSESLKKCYSSSTIALENMLKLVRRSGTFASHKCPYCGITKPLTIDHYFPQDDYPEFSVLQENLVPCCSTCNSIKKAIVFDAGARVFIHFLADLIPDVPFLVLDLKEVNGVIGGRYSFTTQLDLTDPVAARISSHYKKLNLIYRYNEDISDEISLIISSGKTYSQTSGLPASPFLRNEADAYSRIYGRNYWRSLLMRKMSLLPGIDKIIDESDELE